MNYLNLLKVVRIYQMTVREARLIYFLYISVYIGILTFNTIILFIYLLVLYICRSIICTYNVIAMPATPRPRGFSGASTSSGRPSTNTPMSERQQMALLMQMTSPSNQSGIYYYIKFSFQLYLILIFTLSRYWNTKSCTYKRS